MGRSVEYYVISFLNMQPPAKPTVLQNVNIRALRREDFSAVEAILREHVRDSGSKAVIEGEVAAILNYMKGDPDSEGRLRRYQVATDSRGWVIGCVAISTPDTRMCDYLKVDDKSCRELLNAFVATRFFRGNGIGRKLFEAACEAARREGVSELVLNSGPRYSESWGFYDRVCDSSAGFITDYFGTGRDAKTWRKKL